MEIKDITFVKGSARVDQMPHPGIPEVAFIGRSNVGKSSLINMVAGKKDGKKPLARTSGKPGKTREANHFLVDKAWYLVDLPGYGYAQASKTVRAELAKLIDRYLLDRENLTNVFLLVDSRLEPQEADLEYMHFLGANGVPFAITFTKIDKLSSSQLQSNVAAYKRKLLEEWEELPPIFFTSSEDKKGRTELLEYIAHCCQEFHRIAQIQADAAEDYIAPAIADSASEDAG